MTDPLATHAPKNSGVPAFARDFSVSGHVVVVTGAGQGIGRELARQFAAAGAVAVIADLNLDNAKTVAAEIEVAGGPLPGRRRIADKASVDAMVAEALRELGRIDALVNNASIFATLEKRPFDQIPLAEWETVMEVNVTGVFLCARAVAQTMRDQGFGRIVNISSDSVHRGTINYLHYVTSKSALIGMTNSLARELGRLRDHGQCIRPGTVATEVERAVNPTAEVRQAQRRSSVHPPRHGAVRSRRARDVPHDLGRLVHHRPDHRVRRRLHAQLLTSGGAEGPEHETFYEKLFIDGAWVEPSGPGSGT